MSQEWSFEISGLDKLEADIRKTERAAPDIMLKYIRKAGNRFKLEAKKKTEQLTKTRTGKLKKGYKSKVDFRKGSLREYEAQIRGSAPHFHLVEHGHVAKVPDRSGAMHTIGRVTGRKMMAATIADWESGTKMLPFAQKAIDEALKKGLIE